MNDITFSKELFTPVFWKINEAKTRFVINYGGAASSKSYSQGQYEIIKLMQADSDTLVCRKYATDIFDSVFALMKSVLVDWDIIDKFDIIWSNSRREIKFRQTGKRIMFKGLDDVEKVKSIFGIGRVMIEEASQIKKADFMELNRRCRGVDNIQYTLVFNPIHEEHWIKGFFFDSQIISDQTTFIHSTYKDNSFLTSEDIQQIENLKDINYNDYKIYALGEWGRVEVEKPFAYGFEQKRHVQKDLKINYSGKVVLSFDFNIDPITCIVAQGDAEKIYILKEYRLMDSDIYQLCEAIRTDFVNENVYFMITGDATGRGRSAMTRGDLNYFKIIKTELGLNDSQFKIPNINPNVKNSRVLLNALLKKYPIFAINEDCKFLIDDLLYCEVNEYGELDKTRDKHRTHLLDCLRYYLNAFYPNWLDKKTFEYLTK